TTLSSASRIRFMRGAVDAPLTSARAHGLDLARVDQPPDRVGADAKELSGLSNAKSCHGADCSKCEVLGSKPCHLPARGEAGRGRTNYSGKSRDQLGQLVELRERRRPPVRRYVEDAPLHPR